MVALEPDLLLVLIALAAFLLIFGIIAAVHYLWKILRRDARWPGLQNPYGWPAELLGDIDANVVDKSVCKKRLRPSRIEKNAKKFHKALGDVLPEPEAPPVPIRMDSLTKSERQMLNPLPKVPSKRSSTSHVPGHCSTSHKFKNGQVDRKRGSGYREERKLKSSSQAANPTRREHIVDFGEDSEPPPPYSEVRRMF